MESYMRAAQNRSIRTIKTELDFLLDSSLLTRHQLESILSILPSTDGASITASTAARTPAPSTNPTSPPSRNNTHNPIPNGLSNLSLNEKAQTFSPPPAYTAPPHIAIASSLYAYAPTDAGDLGLAPGDRVFISEYSNADWARGRNERTGEEGIFPRSYVSIVEEKQQNGGPPMLPSRNQSQSVANGYGVGGTGYGNMPVEVAHGGGQNGAVQGQNGEPSKFETQGKKFGKKLGNAAIFGAGASIGGNIVNSIF